LLLDLIYFVVFLSQAAVMLILLLLNWCCCCNFIAFLFLSLLAGLVLHLLSLAGCTGTFVADVSIPTKQQAMHVSVLWLLLMVAFKIAC